MAGETCTSTPSTIIRVLNPLEGAKRSDAMLLDALADRDDQAMTAGQVFVLTYIYWLYVTATDVVYAEAMRIYVADFTKEWVFYPWQHRILQHILMFPLLVLCYGTAMHLGWRPVWRRAAVQFLMALGFSLSMYWMARLSAFIFHVITGMPLGSAGTLTRGEWATWVSSAVTTLLAYSFGLVLLTGIATVRTLTVACTPGIQVSGGLTRSRGWTSPARMPTTRTA
jgi:hypothetical protein